uniref:Uncharacterized protein n=1 Tax=viral metagenome TaxID=1070528 RepID=A0A6C0H5M7_9ZZZZ
MSEIKIKFKNVLDESNGQNVKYRIKIMDNGNIYIDGKYDFENKRKMYERLLLIDDNIPIPENYMNIIKVLLSLKPTTCIDMNKIIYVIEEIKRVIKNEVDESFNIYMEKKNLLQEIIRNVDNEILNKYNKLFNSKSLKKTKTELDKLDEKVEFINEIKSLL